MAMRDVYAITLRQVDGTLVNTGHDVKLVLDDTSSSSSAAFVNMSGGPLAYQYRIHELSIHFGRDDARGSEHSIDMRHFPAEVSALFLFASVQCWDVVYLSRTKCEFFYF